MTLVTRVSAYFLAALAVVLLVCSALFYAVVRRQMTRQYEQQLYGALHSLVAAVEIEPEDVNWQPREHIIGLGAREEKGEIEWIVVGDDGRIVEASRNASDAFIAAAEMLARGASHRVGEAESPSLRDWRFLRQRLSAPAPNRSGRELDEFDEICIVVGRSRAGLNDNLAQLAAVAALLPLGGWLAAAAVGRQLCRRALRPVVAMAREARSMSGADFQQRLAVSTSGDELTDLGTAFNTLLNRLERSFNAQRRFAGDAAHELRTPLTVLRGQIEVALRKARSPDEYRQTLSVLHDEASQLQQILESLLFLARADENALAPEAAATSLAHWLPEYLHRWDDHPRREDIRVELDGDANVAVARPLLDRLVDNLVENALKYSAAGTPVLVELSREGANAVISVTDRGQGIAPDDAPSVFDPFFRTRQARQSGVAGVGLGLAIADRMARALQGTLSCESTPGRGSRFSLSIPAASVNAGRS